MIIETSLIISYLSLKGEQDTESTAEEMEGNNTYYGAC